MGYSKRELVKLALLGSQTYLQELPKGELFINDSFLKGFNLGSLPKPERLKRVAQWLDLDLLGVSYEEGEDSFLDMSSDQDQFFSVIVFPGLFSFWQKNLGFFETLKAIARKEERLKEARSFYLKFISQRIMVLYEKGFSGVAIADDLAGERGPMMSVHDFESLLVPFYREIICEVKSKGLFVFFHSCGKLGKIFDSICQLGIDCLYACDHIKDPLEVEKKVKEKGICLMGFIDLLRWEEERIEEEMERLRRMFAKGGLIIGSTSGLCEGITLRRLSILYPRIKESQICQILE